MEVWIVMDGYDDVSAVFLHEANARAFIESEIAQCKEDFHKQLRRQNLSTFAMDVQDAPTSPCA